MPNKNDGFLKKLLATFAGEADEHLNAISAGLLELEKVPALAKQKELIETVFREAHSLKGAARAVDLADIGAVCQPLESMFAALKNGEITASRELFDLLHDAVGKLRHLLATGGAARNAAERAVLESLIQRLEMASKGAPIPEPAARERPTGRRRRAAKSSVASVAESAPAYAEEAERKRLMAEKEAPVETVRIATTKLDSLFQQVEEMIAAKLTAEQLGAQLRETTTEFQVRTKTWETIRAQLRALQSAFERGSHAEDASRLTKLLDTLEAENTAVRPLAGKLDALTATAAADRRVLAKMIDGLLEDAKKLLMLPLSSLFAILPKLVRDLARDYGKEADLAVLGTEIEIDRRIQEEIKDPLIHLVRNCIGHGIESPAERVRNNKPARGTVTVSVSQRDAGKVEIVIADDGAGIDLAKVLSAAQKLGMVSPAEVSSMNDQEKMLLVFHSGISTSPIVTDIAGRGLGLAIVQEKIERLGGTIDLESQRDAGTRFRMTLPSTLAAFRGVVVHTGEQTFVVPTAYVEGVARVAQEEIKTVENRETVRINGHALSLVRLADVLGLQRKRAADQSDSYKQFVVLTAGGERIAFLVDEVRNEQEVLLKGLGSLLPRVRNIAGATVLGTGAIALVLNVPELMKSSIEARIPVRHAAEAEAGETRGRAVLVVEDSITARTLLKNILEASGYEVKTAVDGVDALTALKTEPFDLVVSDIQMPRMDGFDLTMKMRADKKLAEVPVVLVTALASREDRERGIDAGANAYIVKSSFDQTNLLEVIRRLI